MPGRNIVNKSNYKKVLFVILVIGAIALFVFGVQRVWGAFIEFDDTTLREKDSQFYTLLRSDDINIQNSLSSFSREAENLFDGYRLRQLRKEWVESEDRDTSDLKRFLEDNDLIPNPLYADFLMLYKGKIIVSASGLKNYSFSVDERESGFKLCSDADGRLFLAYEFKAAKNITYEALINLEQLYINALGENSETSLMLLDSSLQFMIYRKGENVIVESTDADTDDNITKCRDWISECQKKQLSDGATLLLSDNEGEMYNARMVVISSDDTANGEFSIGVTADYDQAVGPSRRAAEKILIYGGVAVAGVILLVVILLLLRRENTANARELELLKKKNAAMEELNQNMLALSHHQRLETIGTMTASIAHDFNNLLTPIMGYSMMSMEMLEPGQEEIQENLMEVYNASVKAKDMVTRLAEMSRKGKEEEFRIIDPSEIVRNALKVTIPAKPKNVDVKGNFRSGRARMRGDSTQLTQMITNIVLNAYDAMRDQGGTLFVSTGLEDGNIVMRFRDTGSGMDAETVARIFDPFFTTKESGKGTGLGLAIVAQITETHGGKLYVDSEPGEGTEFRITFPVTESMLALDRSKTIQINAAELREMLDEDEK